MKKRALAVVSLMSVILLSGCFGFSSAPSLPDDLPYETFQGTLQSLGHVNFSAKATHLLREKEGGILYVYSDFYDLSQEAYLNHPVEVSGLLLPPDDQSSRETLAIDALTVLPDDALELNSVAREAYTNESMGFTWIFSNDWSIEELPQTVTFTAPLPEIAQSPDDQPVVNESVLQDTIEVRTMPNLQELPIADWYLEYIIPNGVVSPYIKSAIGPEVIPAIRADIKDSAGNTVLYYIADGTQVFIITHHSLQEDHRLDYSNLFADMLYSFDPLSDGLREPVIAVSADDSVPSIDSPELSSPDPVAPDTSNTQAVIDALTKVKLTTLIPQSGFWSATRYEFADPNYVYVNYSNDAGVKGRVLLKYSGSDFERVAAFDEGSVTDWTLVSGVDEAKSKSRTSINVASGFVTSIPEGYRSLESASLHFQMHYPSGWYYSRSGNFFYFSNEPAEAGNALVSMEFVSSPVATYREETAGGYKVAFVPRDGTSSFRLQAAPEYFEALQTMAKSISPTNP